jgi:hypothetical protein
MASINAGGSITIDEVTKVYENGGKIVAFDTDIFHIRIDNIGRSKSLDAIIRRLTDQLAAGSLTVPAVTET